MQKETTGAAKRLYLLLLPGVLFVGNAGCRSRSPAPKTAPVSADTVISHWDSPLQPTVPPSSAAALQQFQAIQKRSRAMLYSRRPFHEVEIPLFFQDGYPFIKASWSGRQIACLVDTGNSTIMWPQWLHLDTQQLHLARTEQWPDSVTVRNEWMLTPRIAVGGYVITDVPTEAIGFSRPKASDPLSMQISYPILGRAAFNPFIMTIDYRAKKIILRDTNYDVTRQPHSKHSRLFPYKEDGTRRVMFPGTLAGHKAMFLLDTGSFEMYITSSFAQKHFSFVPNQAAFGTGTMPVLHNLTGVMSGLHLGAFRFI